MKSSGVTHETEESSELGDAKERKKEKEEMITLRIDQSVMNPPSRAPTILTAPASEIDLKDIRLAFAFAADEEEPELPPPEAVCVKPMGPVSVVDAVAATEADETLKENST